MRVIALCSALFVFSVVITLVVLTSGRAGVSSPEIEIRAEGAIPVERIVEDFSRGGASAAAGSALTVQDFLLPESPAVDGSGPYLLRQRLDRWSEEQVQRYWIPLEDIALDLVVEENDRRIESLFEDIP